MVACWRAVAIVLERQPPGDVVIEALHLLRLAAIAGDHDRFERKAGECRRDRRLADPAGPRLGAHTGQKLVEGRCGRRRRQPGLASEQDEQDGRMSHQ